jgi:Flp pilus assembly protein TadG
MRPTARRHVAPLKKYATKQCPSKQCPSKQRSSKQRRGISAVEFAVCLPLLTLLVLGAIDGANLLFVQQTLCNASYEGARRAVHAQSSGEVTGPVEEFLASAKLSKAKVSLEPSNPTTAKAGQPMVVTTTVNVDSVTMLPASIFAGQTIRARCTMVKE